VTGLKGSVKGTGAGGVVVACVCVCVLRWVWGVGGWGRWWVRGVCNVFHAGERVSWSVCAGVGVGVGMRGVTGPAKASCARGEG
jgi:type IV secretory pathway VirB2 component (pilin)